MSAVRPTSIGVVLFLALTHSGCADLAGRLNSAGLRRDLTPIISRTGVHAELQCQMEAGTRAGACRLTLPRNQAFHLARTLGLSRVSATQVSFSGTCPANPGLHSGHRLFIWAVRGRPPTLRSSTGAAFEYLVLYLHEGGTDACIHTEYSYG